MVVSKCKGSLAVNAGSAAYVQVCFCSIYQAWQGKVCTNLKACNIQPHMQLMQQTYGRHTNFQQLELCISIKVFGLCLSLSGGASATVNDSSLQSQASQRTQKIPCEIEQDDNYALHALCNAQPDQSMFIVTCVYT